MKESTCKSLYTFAEQFGHRTVDSCCCIYMSFSILQWQRIWGAGGGLEHLHFLKWGELRPPPLRIAMNIHSMKLFNNLIKNTLLAPCSVV